MLIWDYIRDFLVQYVFGGYTSELEPYKGFVGNLFFKDVSADSIDIVDEYSDGFCFAIDNVYLGNWGGAGKAYISLGDWLSTTCTIVIMVTIVILFALLVRWVYRAVVSAFLLR